MSIQCRALFTGEAQNLPVDLTLDYSGEEYGGLYPFATPVSVVGNITARAGVVTLRGTISFVYHGRCDRCLSSYTRRYEYPIEHILVTSVENEDSDYVLLEDYQLAPEDLVLGDILLELPYKSLCREDCQGLCSHCGKNLNDGPCGCPQKEEDPRLAVLKQLLK